MKNTNRNHPTLAEVRRLVQEAVQAGHMLLEICEGVKLFVEHVAGTEYRAVTSDNIEVARVHKRIGDYWHVATA